MLLEICVDSVESAVNAELGGADRIELCADLAVGGVTPSLALYELVRERIRLPIHVLLRPRFGDFLYCGDELQIMIRQAELFRRVGANCLVGGCLSADGCLDRENIRRIMDAGGGLPFHLHRCFDMCRDYEEALEAARTLGVAAILTSGGCSSALEGAATLERLKLQAGAVDIIAGGGVSADTLPRLLELTSLTSFHMSGKVIRESGMKYRNPRVHMGLPSLSEYETYYTDVELVKAARRALERTS